MRALTLHLPLMLVMLAAVVWIFIIAAWKPRWFNQTIARRGMWCAIEGIVCAIIWTLLKPVIEQIFGFSGLLDGAVAGLAWAGMSFYGKTRFKADMYQAEKALLSRIFRR